MSFLEQLKAAKQKTKHVDVVEAKPKASSMTVNTLDNTEDCDADITAIQDKSLDINIEKWINELQEFTFKTDFFPLTVCFVTKLRLTLFSARWWSVLFGCLHWACTPEETSIVSRISWEETKACWCKILPYTWLTILRAWLLKLMRWRAMVIVYLWRLLAVVPKIPRVWEPSAGLSYASSLLQVI